MTIRRRTFAIAIVVALLVAVALLVWRGPTHPPAPPSAPSDASVDARPIDDLVALSRLYGYVRFFHPSDEAQLVDWDALAIAAVDATLEAHDAEELATALRDAFTPVAPSIQIWVGASAPAAPTIPDAASAPRRVGYRHVGVALGAKTPPLYSSTRIEEARASAPEKVLAEGTSVVEDLGGGVWCRIPLTLVADATGTLPHPAGHRDPRKPARPPEWRPTATDRSVRLAAVMLAWNVPQHFYPYFDVVTVDWNAELRKALTKASTDADARALLDTLRTMVAQLHDGHGHVMGGNVAATRVLPIDWAWAGAELVVTSSRQSELRVGDVVLSIDGRSVDAVLLDVARTISSATPGWTRHEALAAMREMDTADPAVFKVRRASGAEDVVLVARVASFQAAAERLPRHGVSVAPGILYFDLDHASRAELDAVLPALARARGLVFDMRGYPGSAGIEALRHLTDKPVTGMQWLAPVALRPDREGVSFERLTDWNLKPATPRLPSHCVFLIDGGAISQAESVLGIVEHEHLCALVGETTAGTDGDINPFDLPGGYMMIWTGLRVLKPDGGRNHGVGIAPTVPVSRTPRGIADGRDELLEKAIAILDEAPKP